MVEQTEKFERFKALHLRDTAFVMPNPWDAGSARLLTSLCREVDKPVNVVMGLKGKAFAVDELSGAGVRRISVGGSFARAALGALMRAAEEVRTSGTFSYATEAIPGSVISQLMLQDQHQTRV